MNMGDPDSRLHRIFRELQEKGLIDRGRRLVRCTLTPSIRGCPALNCIRYRRSFYEKNLLQADDDALRFVLLHEEGHTRHGSPLLSLLPALPILPCLMLSGHPVLQAESVSGGKAVFIALILLTIFLSYRVYYRQMYDEEFVADRYAADALRRCYRIQDPGALLQTLLSDLRSGAGTRYHTGSDPFSRVISGFFHGEPDYRPPLSERVLRVREDTVREDNNHHPAPHR